VRKLNVRELYPIIKAIQFRDHCSMTFNNEGLRLIVDDQHNEQCNCYLRTDIFTDYNLHSPNQVHLRVQLNTLAESLNAFSGQSAILTMHYNGEGEPLVMNVEDEGVVFTCGINTLVPQHILDFEFDSLQVLGRIVLDPNALRNVIRELDPNAPAVLLTLNRNGISLVTEGELGRIRVRIPARSEQVELLECGEEQIRYHYRLSLVKRMQSVIALSNKVSLRIDYRGVLDAQFLVPISENKHIFIDFMCVADNDLQGAGDIA